jgi:hypothetical protein
MKNQADLTEQILSEYKAMSKRSTADLKAVLKRTHRIIDLRDCCKDQLKVMILQAQYGRKAMAKAFNWDN